MTIYLYSYYNKKIGAYTSPQGLPHRKEEKKEMDQRAFVLGDEKTKVTMEEHDLYYLGEMDDKSGVISLNDKPEYLCSFVRGDQDGK